MSQPVTKEQRSLFLPSAIIPLGFQYIDDLSTVQSLSPPQHSRFCYFHHSVQICSWRDDEVDPTDAIGMFTTIAPFLYTGDLTKIKFIERTAGAKLHISFYH